MATVGVGSGVVLLERQRVGVVLLERLHAVYCWRCNIGTSVCKVFLELYYWNAGLQRIVGVVLLERRSARYSWSCNIGTPVCNALLELERQRITSINASSQTTKKPSQTFRHPEILKATLS